MASFNIENGPFCRTCLETDVPLRYLTEDNLVNILKECTSVKVCDDERVRMICGDCSQQLITFNRFRVRCLEADAIVRSATGNIKQELQYEDGDKMVPVKVETIEGKFSEDYDDDAYPDECEVNSEVDEESDYGKKKKVVSRLRSTRRSRSRSRSRRTKSIKIRDIKCNVCIFCTKLCTDKRSLRAHISQHHPETLNQKTIRSCPHCTKTFRSLKLITKHINMAHKNAKPKLLCDECSHKFHTAEQVQSHKQKFHVSVECKICLKVILGHYRLKAHIQRHGKQYLRQQVDVNRVVIKRERVKQELECVLTDKTDDILNNHVPKEEGKVFKCSFCPKTFSQKPYMRRHTLVHHSHLRKEQAEMFQCQDCPKSFPQINLLTKHVKYHHTQEARYSCDKCEEKFFVKPALEKHIERNHTLKYCPYCDKRTTTQKKLRRHINRVHPTTEPLTCPICEKKFKLKKSLRTHMDRHNGVDKRKICSICGLKLTNIEKHMYIVHKIGVGKRTFTCRRCDEKFDDATLARKHAATMHKKKREPEDYTSECKLCNKRLLNKYNLERHCQTVHSKVALYKCSICGKEMRHKQSYRLHLLAHTSERPHQCESCDKKFLTKYMLVRHRRTHTGEMRYGCSFCDRRFIHYTSYSLHKKTHLSAPVGAVIPDATLSVQNGRFVRVPSQMNPMVMHHMEKSQPLSGDEMEHDHFIAAGMH